MGWVILCAHTGCFHVTSVLAIFDLASCGGGAKKSFSPFCGRAFVDDMCLIDEAVALGLVARIVRNSTAELQELRLQIELLAKVEGVQNIVSIIIQNMKGYHVESKLRRYLCALYKSL